MNLQEINRKLSYLEINKVEASVYDMQNDMFISSIEQLKKKLNELIDNLNGYSGDQHEINKGIKFVKEDEFERYKKNVGYELERIWTEIGILKENNKLLFEKTKDRCTLKDIASNNNYLLQKIDEILEGLNKKFVQKSDNANAFKNLEDQFKRIVLLLSTKVNHESDNWLLAKKPINGYSCAACESYIGDLKDEKNEKYVDWKKMPAREREKEQDKEKIYRLGNGYSHILKMLKVDNNKNVSLDPNKNKNMKIFIPGNVENDKSIDILLRKTFPERTKSACPKDPNEKTFELVKSKNFERKFPKIKPSSSTEDFDRVIENPHRIINLKENFMSPKIMKIMKKTHSKLKV